MHSSASSPDSGQATVELALVMPLIIGLLLIILTAGLVVRDQLAVWHAASAGARAASISPDSPDVVQQAVEAEVQLRPIHLRVVREGDLIWYADCERHYLRSDDDVEMRFVEFFVPGVYKTTWAPGAMVCTWSPTGRNIRGGEAARAIAHHRSDAGTPSDV